MYKAESLVLNDEVRQSITDGAFIDLPSGNTHYKCEGESGEWCVLVHGYATPYYIYDKIAEGLLNAGYRVLRYDLLGRGLSERVEKVYNPALFVKQLEDLTQAILGDEKFYLMGTSMGGIITTSFVAANPDKVKKLVLLAPAGMRFKVPFYMKLSNVKGLGDFVFNHVAAKTLTSKCASELIYSDEQTAISYREKFAFCAQYKGMVKSTLSSLRNTILNFDESIKGYNGVRESKIPVLTIWGTDDKTMPYYQAATMQKVLPDMKLITYEKSGHIFLYDEGERTLNDILPFLAE